VISAGFDYHEEDWRGIITTSDYQEMGESLRSFAEKVCDGRG
jgi:acetoin utilization deacetylase AcuC-like enzyme